MGWQVLGCGLGVLAVVVVVGGDEREIGCDVSDGYLVLADMNLDLDEMD